MLGRVSLLGRLGHGFRAGVTSSAHRMAVGPADKVGSSWPVAAAVAGGTALVAHPSPRARAMGTGRNMPGRQPYERPIRPEVQLLKCKDLYSLITCMTAMEKSHYMEPHDHAIAVKLLADHALAEGVLPAVRELAHTQELLKFLKRAVPYFQKEHLAMVAWGVDYLEPREPHSAGELLCDIADRVVHYFRWRPTRRRWVEWWSMRDLNAVLLPLARRHIDHPVFAVAQRELMSRHRARPLDDGSQLYPSEIAEIRSGVLELAAQPTDQIVGLCRAYGMMLPGGRLTAGEMDVEDGGRPAPEHGVSVSMRAGAHRPEQGGGDGSDAARQAQPRNRLLPFLAPELLRRFGGDQASTSDLIVHEHAEGIAHYCERLAARLHNGDEGAWCTAPEAAVHATHLEELQAVMLAQAARFRGEHPDGKLPLFELCQKSTKEALEKGALYADYPVADSPEEKEALLEKMGKGGMYELSYKLETKRQSKMRSIVQEPMPARAQSPRLG